MPLVYFTFFQGFWQKMSFLFGAFLLLWLVLIIAAREVKYRHQTKKTINIWNLQVPVFYLNAEFDYRNMLEPNRPDIDCLHTVKICSDFPQTSSHIILKSIGGATIANARAADHLHQNLPLHFCLPQVQLCLCLLFWLPSPGQQLYNFIPQTC